jgi:secondary thiamine-phosphate synthase enzyme
MTSTNGRAAMTQTSLGAGGFIAETRALVYQTGVAPQFLDITDDVLAAVTETRVQAGQVTVFSQHTTAAIAINEHEPLLLRDMARLLRGLAPVGAHYEHNDFTMRTVNMNADECPNGHAHCQHLFLRTSETIPIIDGVPALGPYQRIFLVELDHPRSRRVLVSVMGTRQ